MALSAEWRRRRPAEPTAHVRVPGTTPDPAPARASASAAGAATTPFAPSRLRSLDSDERPALRSWRPADAVRRPDGSAPHAPCTTSRTETRVPADARPAPSAAATPLAAVDADRSSLPARPVSRRVPRPALRRGGPGRGRDARSLPRGRRWSAHRPVPRSGSQPACVPVRPDRALRTLCFRVPTAPTPSRGSRALRPEHTRVLLRLVRARRAGVRPVGCSVPPKPVLLPPLSRSRAPHGARRLLLAPASLPSAAPHRRDVRGRTRA